MILIKSYTFSFLRKLFNILKGDMTIVGPRPIDIDELDFYGEFEDYYKSVKPGLTGPWQVNGRSEISLEERMKMDIEYVNNYSLSKDIKYFLGTFTKLFQKEGAI